jgi:predicted HicB family RNase H-like nuclease
MDSKKTTLISLRVDPDVARAFKIEAARRDLKLNGLFEEIFRAYEAGCTSEKKRGRSDG